METNKQIIKKADNHVFQKFIKIKLFILIIGVLKNNWINVLQYNLEI